MTTKRRLALLSTLSATTPAFAAPFLAIGDNAELFLTARAEIRHEDNVTFSTNDQIRDEVFEFSPGVELLFGKNTLTKGSFVAFERFSAYSDNTDLNSNLTNLLFNSAYEGARLDLSANASFRELNQNSRDARAAATLVRRDVYAAGINGEYSMTEKSKLGLGGSYTFTQYKNALFTNQKNYTVPVNYFFAITEKVDLSGGLQYRQNQVSAANADSEDFYFNVGARGEFTPKLTGSFSVGYILRKPEDPARDDEGSLGFKTGLDFAFTPKTNFTLDLSRDFEVGADASGLEASSIALGARSSLTAAWNVSATLSYSRFEYLTSDRTEDYYIAGVSVGYIYNEMLNFEAGYSINSNSSTVAEAEFTANVFRIAANFRY
jgi:polysaccharide biosynthesis protein VpsM